jgi:hypothetical protein
LLLFLSLYVFHLAHFPLTTDIDLQIFNSVSNFVTIRRDALELERTDGCSRRKALTYERCQVLSRLSWWSDQSTLRRFALERERDCCGHRTKDLQLPEPLSCGSQKLAEISRWWWSCRTARLPAGNTSQTGRPVYLHLTRSLDHVSADTIGGGGGVTKFSRLILASGHLLTKVG